MRTKPDHVLFRLGKGILFILFIIGFIIPTTIVQAHPADMYAQDQSIQIDRDALQVEWKIIPGPMLAGILWDNADLNQDGNISLQEGQAWVEPFLSQWEAWLDDQPIQSATLKDIHWPSKIDSLQTGDEPIDIVLVFQLPAGLSGIHSLKFHNTFQESISLNWFSLKSTQGISFDEPEQSNSQIITHINFSPASAGSSNQPAAGLNTWESGKPSVPGLAGAVSNLALSLADPQPRQASTQNKVEADTSPLQTANPASPTSALTSLIKTQNFSPLFLVGAFLLSLALGSLHALTPGHGKTLVAAYLVGSHGKTRDAVFLGSVVTVTHTGSVLFLGLVTLVASRYILPTLILPWLEVISGLFVILFGLNLLVRRGKTLVSWSNAQRTKSTQQFTSIQPANARTSHANFIANPHSPGKGLHHNHRGVSAGEISPHDHESHSHSHSHSLPAERVTLLSLLALGISGGLIPCPDAIAILLVAVAVNRIPFGMLLIVAFSLGLALILIGIGIAMVQGFRLLQRNDLINRFSIFSPVASSVVVLALGIGLTASALNSFPVYAGTKQPVSSLQAQETANILTPTAEQTQTQLAAPAFNFDQAKILYIEQDKENHDQLFIASISGKDPVQITQEATGILGYTVSPDKQTILYTTLKMDGDSSIWMIDRDGTNQRMVLDCPTAQCGGPVWSPDGQKLIYERHDYNQNTNLALFSLWWLDLKSGETKSVFRDQSFPGFAPAFSADGKWLSYISPSNNSIQIFSLDGEQSHSIPYWSGIPEQWSPVDDSVLYWDLDTQSQQPSPQLKRYDLATSKIFDLSGESDQQDYPVAWSPDGQWIAIVRFIMGSDSSSNKDQIWLVKPDGTQAYVFLDLDGIFYSHIGWTPDSQKLVYSRNSIQDLSKEEIWLADVHNGQQTRLISGGYMPEILP